MPAVDKSLAELAWNEDWPEIRLRVESNHTPDLHELFFGMTVLHWACYYGNSDVVALLVQQTNIDINAPDTESGQTPLHWAVFKGSLPCIEALLDAGAIVHSRTKDGRTLLDLARTTPHTAIVQRLIQAGGDPGPSGRRLPARLSFIQRGDVVKVHEWLSMAPTSVDARAEEDRTPLMLAAGGGHFTIVELILKRSPDLDAQDSMGRTALMYAALAGHPLIVDLLLGQFADIDLLDNEGLTVLGILDQTIKNMMNGPEKEKLERCASIIQKEAKYRDTSSIYRSKVRDQVLERLREGFDESVFKMAIQCDPALGRWMLNDCLIPSRHALAFHELEKVYGHKGIRKSALYTILKVSDNSFVTKKLCLDHIVIRRILQIKWELFGKRMYIEKILMYLLLLTCITVSATTSKNDLVKPTAMNSVFLFSILNFAIVCIFLVFGWLAAQMLRPKPLWCFTRYLVDGKVTSFDAGVSVTASNRSRAQWYILIGAIVLSILACIPAVWFLYIYATNEWYPRFNTVNIVLLACTTVYFLYLEIKGMANDYIAGFNPSKGGYSLRGSLYFRSVLNWCQVTVYLVILIFYVPWELGAFPVDPSHVATVHICLGTFLSLSLWAMSLQFLQVHPSAGYLLPMLSGLLGDVWNFILLYGVLQWGLSCAYMHIIKPPENGEAGYETWFRAFTFAYFVLVGEVDVEEKFGQSNHVVYAYGRFIVMVQVAISSVLLLNMLVATMNKRVLDGLQVAKIEALASYARFVLRLEGTLSPSEQSEIKYMADATGHASLHPTFYESIVKPSEFSCPSDIEVVEGIQAQRQEWIYALEELQSMVLAEYKVWYAIYSQHEMDLQSSEQLVAAQFNFAMTKPHVNFLCVDETLTQLAAWIELHLKTLPVDEAHMYNMHTHVLPRFHQIGQVLAANARARVAPQPKSSTTIEETKQEMLAQIQATEARGRQNALATQEYILQEMQRQNSQMQMKLLEMETRLSQLIQQQLTTRK
ncbi:hypothetical protein LEN26_000010 [Aphanomyces euteiches]|nr:hypothetical protein AeMF1_012842 [Aphanomyces euteiches]KAH9164488.1 hypothetical protein LEN26_000010 [Aphanomyces euteiches]